MNQIAYRVPINCETTQLITYPGIKPMYSISTSGEVYNCITGERLIGYTVPDGNISITLKGVYGSVNILLHRLVAYQFCNPPANFESMAVNHINGNCNFANNLEWSSYVANNRYQMTYGENRRPIVNEELIHYICQLFVSGKSNKEIMTELNMNEDNANHTFLRDIRGGYTWKHISQQYEFSRSSKKHAYAKEEKELIAQYIRQRHSNQEVFVLMQGREYIPSTDRLTSEYKTIDSIRRKIRKNEERADWL